MYVIMCVSCVLCGYAHYFSDNKLLHITHKQPYAMSDSKRSRPDDSPDNPTLKRNRSDDTPKAKNVAGNRRMFGALMGHLGRAQKKLDADSEVINMQVARRQEASQKNTEESKRVAKLQRTLSVEQKEKVIT